MKALLFKLIFVFKTLYVTLSYNLENGYLIDELASSSNQCIKKLTPVLQSLPLDEQKLLANSISNSTERCFNPLKYKPSAASNLKDMNVEYAWKVGNKTNTLVKPFECFINAAKSRLDDKYIEYIKNTLSSITPWGIYPGYTLLPL